VNQCNILTAVQFVKRHGSACAQALVRVHFNTGDPKAGGAANRAQKVVDAIAMVKLRMACK